MRYALLVVAANLVLALVIAVPIALLWVYINARLAVAFAGLGQ